VQDQEGQALDCWKNIVETVACAPAQGMPVMMMMMMTIYRRSAYMWFKLHTLWMQMQSRVYYLLSVCIMMLWWFAELLTHL